MKRQSITKPKASESTTGQAVVTLKKILVPTDFSDASGKALEYAAVFAAQFGAAITLLHIAEIDSMGYSLADIQQGYEVFGNRQEGVLKVLITP